MTDSKDKKTTAGEAKTAATKTTQAAAKNTLTASTLPTAADLKDRFKAGSIPLQTDFADLIDMANTGAQAIGKAAGQNGPGPGLSVTDAGLLNLNIGAYNYKDDKTGFSPIKVNTTDNTIVVDLDVGTQDLGSGLGVKAGEGIKVDDNGVSVDMAVVIPRGIITMFSGEKVPDGWLFCDGTQGTPNLLNRFILGGYVDNVGEKNSVTFSGDLDNKKLTISTNKISPDISVTVAGHQLTVAEMPSHTHSVRGYQNTGGVHLASNGSTSATIHDYDTNVVGGNKTHNHSASASQTAHSHQAEVTVPYYILAFIMKS